MDAKGASVVLSLFLISETNKGKTTNMKTTIKSIVAAALCAVGLSAFAEDPVTYLDWDEVNHKLTNATCTAYETVTASSPTSFAAGKTYVVKGAVTRSGAITVKGVKPSPTRFILCDGAKLTASKGLVVSANYALVICAQEGGTGALEAKGASNGAGIGGGRSGAGGRVTIRSGAVSTTGGVGAEDIGRGAGLQDNGEISVSGGIFARPVQDAWLADDCSVITNQDAATVAAYPWAVVPYPAAWPAADEAVKAKFKEWRTGVGASADLSTDDAQKAFLLNVAVTGIKELKIESIEVDAEGYATIVVSAPGAFFFDRINLGEINGILQVQAGKTLETMTPKAVAYWTTTNGKAMIKVKENFIRAVLGFKTPDVAADTLHSDK